MGAVGRGGGSVDLALNNAKNALPVQISGLGLEALVLNVDYGSFKNVRFFDFWEEACDRGGKFAALEVEACHMQISRKWVKVRREGIGRDNMGGVGAKKMLASGWEEGRGGGLLGVTEEVGERYCGPLVTDRMKSLANTCSRCAGNVVPRQRTPRRWNYKRDRTRRKKHSRKT